MRPGRTAAPSSAAAWLGLAVLTSAMILSAIDRQILILITEPLKRSLALSDTDVGLLNGLAITLVSAAATYPMGMLADRFDRRRLLAVCILLWSLAAALCGLARSFGGLFACSMGIAIGEAVLGPISYSLIADLFPRERWIIANYVFYLGNVLGGAAGLALSGAAVGFAATHRDIIPGALFGPEPWRLAMLIVALPGPLIAIAVLAMRTRRSAKTTAATLPAMGAYLRAHAATLVGVFLGFGFSAAAYATLSTWVLIGLTRNFGQSAVQVGARYGLVLAVASLAGVLLSGQLIRMLRSRFGELVLLRVAQAGVAVAAMLMLMLLYVRTPAQVYVAQLAITIPLIVAISVSPTFLQNIAPGAYRARVIAMGGLVYVVLNAVTPIAVGMISDSGFGRSNGLYPSMLVIALPCALAGVALLELASRTLADTFAAAREHDQADEEDANIYRGIVESPA
ncbi:MAG TPA: MFS transporter [Sphingomonas sp.]|nr:MFS transporter [Sphingomonas sp.]